MLELNIANPSFGKRAVDIYKQITYLFCNLLFEYSKDIGYTLLDRIRKYQSNGYRMYIENDRYTREFVK